MSHSSVRGSLPSRGRGLKYLIEYFLLCFNGVAPFTGAWIEISEFKSDSKSKESLPSRGRGLKFGTDISVHEIDPVAPFTGAWIEISYWKVAKNVKLGSLPSRGRGLKF